LLIAIDREVARQFNYLVRSVQQKICATPWFRDARSALDVRGSPVMTQRILPETNGLRAPAAPFCRRAGALPTATMTT
jgi:hypothetical protein